MNARADSCAIADHSRALYGADGGDVPGVFSVFTLPGKHVDIIPGDELFGETPNRVAAVAETENVYHTLGLLKASPREGRGKAEDVLAMPALAVDIDIAGPNHKGAQYPRSTMEALDFIADIGIQPSLVNHTGGGLHVFWIFRELVVFTSDAERIAFANLSDHFHRAVIARGATRGWKLDNTGDLARLFRFAGTVNHKTEQRQMVRTLWASDARYTPGDFTAFAASAAPSPVQRVAKTDDVIGAGRHAETMRALIAAGRKAGFSNDLITDSLHRRIERYIARVGQRAEGARDNTAFQIAVWLVNDFGVSESVAFAYLAEWNARNSPPLPERQLKAKLHSAKRSSRRPAGCAHLHRGSAA
jgi:hypothetical protein